jgi:hypothetical protein
MDTVNKERKLNEPFRWQAPPMTKTEVSAIKVIDTPACLRLELFTPAPNGERLVQGIDVPFMPTAMHADCISIKNHDRMVERAVNNAVTSAVASANARAEAAEARAAELQARLTALEEATNATLTDASARVKAMEAENEQMRRQSAALMGVVTMAADIDKLNLLFLHRPSFAHTLRTRLKAYGEGNFPVYVTKTEHDAALAVANAGKEEAIAKAVQETVKRVRTAFDICTRRLSAIAMENPTIDVKPALDMAERALESVDHL